LESERIFILKSLPEINGSHSMPSKDNRRPMTVIIVAVFALGLAGLIAWALRDPPRKMAEPSRFNLPELSTLAQSGKSAFDANCALCHGENAMGSDQGPPLVHVIYEPNHHGDQSFRLATKRGVRAHHWNYGDMPPQPEVNDDDMTGVIAYVRELQRANGIGTRLSPTRMAPGG
jgi:mono/diheme cytochrome c family protein